MFSGARCFYCKYFVDVAVDIKPLPFACHFIQQTSVDLMVQKIVHFQDAAGFDGSVLYDTFFKKLQNATSKMKENTPSFYRLLANSAR